MRELKNGLKLQEARELWDKIQLQLSLAAKGLGCLEISEWTRAVNSIQNWSGV